MKNDFVTWFLLSAFTCACIWCGCQNREPEPKTPNWSETEFPYATLTTVKHDGHKFVLFTGNNRGGILHHPSCECMEK